MKPNPEISGHRHDPAQLSVTCLGKLTWVHAASWKFTCQGCGGKHDLRDLRREYVAKYNAMPFPSRPMKSSVIPPHY